MEKISILTAGDLAAETLRVIAGTSTPLQAAYKDLWNLTTQSMTEVSLRGAGDLAIGTLKGALTKAEIQADERAPLVGYFCNEWNRRVAPESRRITETNGLGSRKHSKSIAEVAETIRAEFEVYHDGDLTALNDCCHSMSQALFDGLVKAGYTPSRVVGQYLGADEDFEPNTSEWEQDDIDNFDRDSGFKHWWIEVEGTLVDICADQFHPGSRLEYRIMLIPLPALEYERQVDQPQAHSGRRLSRSAARRP